MSSTSDSRRTAILGIALLVVLFFGINIFADVALRRARIDLTANKLYTLSSGTKSILTTLKEPIKLTLFYSESLATGRPQLQAYGKRVIELMEEYRLRSGGRITIEVLDPEPFSDAEVRAQREGIAAVPVGANEDFYFGLVGTNSTTGRETIRFFDPGEERFLEYELTRLVYRLSNVEQVRVVVVSSLNLDGAPAMPGMPPDASRPWQIMREMRTLFDAEVLPADSSSLPEGTDLLIVFHVKAPSESLLSAIDEFIAAGGSTIVCVDPLCDFDIPPGAAQNPMLLQSADRSSNLNALLEKYGVTLEIGKVVGDMKHAMRGRAPGGRDLVPYLHYIALGRESFDEEDAIARGVSQMQFVSAGSLKFDDTRGTVWAPLIRSSDESALVAIEQLGLMMDPAALVANFTPSGEQYVIAARVTGSPEAETESAPTTAQRSINLLVIADADFLADRMWIEEMRFGNMLLGYQKFSDNGDFMMSAIDNLAGSSDLISVRARGSFARPFTLVDKIQREAEQRYLSEAQALQEKRRETEQRLSELQRARPDQGELILSPEQQAEVDRFREELASTNAQLRQVQFNLRKDVENLGQTFKVVNTIAAPALVAIFAIGLGIYRSARRRADRRAMAGQG